MAIDSTFVAMESGGMFLVYQAWAFHMTSMAIH